MATAIASRVTTVTNIRKRFINPHSLEKPRRSAPPRLHNEVQYEGQLRFAQPLRLSSRIDKPSTRPGGTTVPESHGTHPLEGSLIGLPTPSTPLLPSSCLPRRPIPPWRARAHRVRRGRGRCAGTPSCPGRSPAERGISREGSERINKNQRRGETRADGGSLEAVRPVVLAPGPPGSLASPPSRPRRRERLPVRSLRGHLPARFRRSAVPRPCST